MTRTAWLLSLLLALAGCSAPPAKDEAMPPGPRVVRIVGYNDMREMLEALRAEYEPAHPGVRIELELPGTRSAPPALASGRSLLAPMGAEFSAQELADYRARRGSEPAAWRVAHASLSPKALSGPLAIVVHPSNPLRELSMDEVADIFTGRDPDPKRLPVGLAPTTALGMFMRAHALDGAAFAAGFEGHAQSSEVVARVARDPRTIGFAAAVRVDAGVRALRLRPRGSSSAVELTAENLVGGRYPLDRPLLIYSRSPLEDDARDFLGFVLSARGQRIVGGGSLGYLPLSAEEAEAERRRLATSARAH